MLDPPPSRADLIARLRGHGVPVEPAGQAPAHLTAFLAAHGVLCRGADAAPREPGYRPVPPGREFAVEELARGYLGAFGPAGPADFAAWAGLAPAVARRAFEAAGAVEVLPGLAALPGAAPPAPGPPLVRLLGPYDTYLLGYRSRELMLDPARTKLINAGGGVVRPALVVDGRVLGTWRRAAGELLVEVFEPLPATVRAGLEEEAGALRAFLCEALPLRVEEV